MISPDNFRARWCDDEDETLVVYPPEALLDVEVSEATKRFLGAAGLPESAAPFFDFEAKLDGTGRLVRADELWRIDEQYRCYAVIGSNGSGDPICIDESASGEIVCLNHDDSFGRVMINSSVEQLAESLLAFRVLVRETQNLNGEEAFLDGDVPKELLIQFTQELNEIDSRAAEMIGGLWKNELERR